MRGPGFIIIGAMKCGTSTLALQLGAQEGVFMTDPKEPNYFSDDDVFAKGPEWYGDLFANAGGDEFLGEASTHYTKRPDYPQTLPRMTAALPDLKLVYMIRDPLVRIVSHYIHEWSQAVLSVPLSAALTDHRPLIDYGRYGWQIEPYVEAYGAENILLTSLERMKLNPEQELARVAAHIGFEGPVTWSETVGRDNVSADRVRKLPFHGLLIDHPVSTALRRALFPKTVRTWVRNRRKMRVRPELTSAEREMLIETYRDDRTRLAQVFPGDPSLDLAYPWLGEVS